MAAPVEAIADSLDEQADEPRKGGGKLDSAIQGEFGEYDFDESQLKASAPAVSCNASSVAHSLEMSTCYSAV